MAIGSSPTARRTAFIDEVGSDRPDHRSTSQVTVTKFGSADRRRGMQSPRCKAGGDAVGGVGQSPDEIRPSIYVL